MNTLKIVLLGLCISLLASCSAAPRQMPRFETDPQTIILGIKGNVDYIGWGAEDWGTPQPDCREPCTYSWNATFNAKKAVSLGGDWCTADQATLADNLKHLTFTITIDGQPVPGSALQIYSHSWKGAIEPGGSAVPQECASWGAVAYEWPVGTHKVVQNMTLDADINDGWNLYHKGTYANEFNVTVTK